MACLQCCQLWGCCYFLWLENYLTSWGPETIAVWSYLENYSTVLDSLCLPLHSSLSSFFPVIWRSPMFFSSPLAWLSINWQFQVSYQSGLVNPFNLFVQSFQNCFKNRLQSKFLRSKFFIEFKFRGILFFPCWNSRPLLWDIVWYHQHDGSDPWLPDPCHCESADHAWYTGGVVCGLYHCRRCFHIR